MYMLILTRNSAIADKPRDAFVQKKKKKKNIYFANSKNNYNTNNINYCVRGDTNLRAGRGQHQG